MDILVVSILAIFFYVVAAIIQSMGLMSQQRCSKPLMLCFGFGAVCSHGLLLHHWIDLAVGQNLNFFNMLSLSLWLVAVLVLVMAMFRAVDALVLILFPVAAISILLVLRFPEVKIINAMETPIDLFHILLSIITFCVLCVAGLLALLLAFQDFLLRKKQNVTLFEALLPLESLERLLFQVNGLGFVLLSVLIITSLYFFHSYFFHNISLLHKTLLAATAWLIFAMLLFGRFVWGWRGRKSVNGTLLGVLLLFFVYFGSKFFLGSLH